MLVPKNLINKYRCAFVMITIYRAYCITMSLFAAGWQVLRVYTFAGQLSYVFRVGIIRFHFVGENDTPHNKLLCRCRQPEKGESILMIFS